LSVAVSTTVANSLSLRKLAGNEPTHKNGCGVEEKKHKKCMTEPKYNHASDLAPSNQTSKQGESPSEAAAKAISFRDKICCLRIDRDIFSQPVRWSRISRINLGKFVLRCWGHQFSEAALCSVQLSTKSLKAASCLGIDVVFVVLEKEISGMVFAVRRRPFWGISKQRGKAISKV
jgi:hypothetical protein